MQDPKQDSDSNPKPIDPDPVPDRDSKKSFRIHNTAIQATFSVTNRNKFVHCIQNMYMHGYSRAPKRLESKIEFVPFYKADYQLVSEIRVFYTILFYSMLYSILLYSFILCSLARILRRASPTARPTSSVRGPRATSLTPASVMFTTRQGSPKN